MRIDRQLCAGLVSAAILAACSGDPSGSGDEHIVYGAPVDVGNGTARSYIITRGATPIELGIAMSEGALEGLPGGTTPQDAQRFILSLPSGNSTGYQVVELNWNPGGHPPPMVYTVPHFDFHFYTVPLTQVEAILPADPEFGAKAANLPAESTRPDGYAPDVNPVGAIAGVPRMGVHWTDRTSHEFHGQPFTATFVVGSWDGEFTFLEPMVEFSYLKSKPNYEAAVQVPSAFGAAGDRPTGYRVAWNESAAEYRIALTDLGGD